MNSCDPKRGCFAVPDTLAVGEERQNTIPLRCCLSHEPRAHARVSLEAAPTQSAMQERAA